VRRPDDVCPGPAPRGALRPAGPISLARALSKLGVCSRREAGRWIEAGRVRVNGREERSARRPIDPDRDRILVDGRRVDVDGRLVLALHKPVGLVTTRVDPGGRPTVYESLRDVDRWVFPVGRLDRDTSGLLICTNDVCLGRRLSDPLSHVPRTYHARVRGHPDAETLRALREGFDLGDGTLTRPAFVRALGSPRSETSPGVSLADVRPLRGSPVPGVPGGTWLEIVLTEGKRRQVRRMCARLGHDVLELVRVRIGHLDLGDLAPGEWRALAPGEAGALFRRGRSNPRRPDV
jgi:23S rRNA pseudouridine2605 synthase